MGSEMCIRDSFMTAFMDELDRLYATPETDATDVTPPDLHGV